MVFVNDAQLDGECFPDVIRPVCRYFQKDGLLEDKVQAIKAFFKKETSFFAPVQDMGNKSCSNEFLLISTADVLWARMNQYVKVVSLTFHR